MAEQILILDRLAVQAEDLITRIDQGREAMPMIQDRGAHPNSAS